MSVRKNLYLAFAQEYSVFIINFINSIIIARLLTPNETGVYALSAMFVVILMQLRQFGMGTYVVQSKELDPERAGSALGVMYVISWSLGLLIILLTPAAADFYNEPRLKPSMLILSVTFFLAPLYQYGMALMERRMQFAQILRITVVSTLMNFIVGVGAALYGAGYLSLPLGYVSYTITSFLMVQFMRPEGTLYLPKFSKWRDVLGFGSYTSGAGLVSTIGKQMPEVVLGKLSGVTTVGLYSRASGLTLILQTLIISAITRTVNASLAHNRRLGHPLGPDYLNAVGLATGLGWSAFTLLALVAKPLVNFLYGANWIPSAPYLSLLCLHQMLLLSLVAYSEMMTLHGAFKRLFVVELCLALFALVNFTFWARLDPHYGAASRVLEGILFFTIFSWMLKRHLHIGYRDLLPIYLKSLLLAVITCLPALMVNYLMDWPARLSFLFLTLLAIASGLFWLAGLFLVKHPLAPHVRQLMVQMAARIKARRA